MNKIRFETNINCNNCIRAVSPFLNNVDSIDSWQVDLANPKKILTVISENGSESEVVEAVLDAGFEIKLIEN